MTKVVIAEPERGSKGARDRLSEIGTLVMGPYSRADLLAALADAEILTVRLSHRIDARVLAAAPRLKIIASATTGLDHIDLEEAEARGIEVVSLRGERAFLETVHATAEHCWGLLLALCRRIPAASRHVQDGGFDRDLFWGRELAGMRLGIVGFGRLGSRVAAYGKAFGMEILVADPHCASVPDGVDLVPLDTLLANADVLSLHVPLNDETRQMIGEEQLALMNKEALLINTSRGAVIDEDALLSALENRALAGAALDVLAGEEERPEGWPEGDPLIAYAASHENLIITPHIGGATLDSIVKTEDFIAGRILEAWRRIQGS